MQKLSIAACLRSACGIMLLLQEEVLKFSASFSKYAHMFMNIKYKIHKRVPL